MHWPTGWCTGPTRAPTTSRGCAGRLSGWPRWSTTCSSSLARRPPACGSTSSRPRWARASPTRSRPRPPRPRAPAGGGPAAPSSAGVEVVADEPERWPTVAGSDTELTRVVRNLLSNAVRHTPAGGRVALSAGTTEAQAWLRIQDACGGIPDADLDRIFDVGYRGAAARTPGTDSGAGLGLAIARALT